MRTLLPRILPRLAALLVLCSAAQVSHAQFSIDRESVTLNPTSASERSTNLVIRNVGATTLKGSIQLEDWDVDANGASHWKKSGAVAGSCGRRVVMSANSLQLAPGEQRSVQVSLKPGAQFDAECWSAAVVTTTDSNNKVASKAEMRTTVPLYVTPSGLNVDGELSDMYVKGDSLEVIFRNTGKLRATIVGEVQVQATGDSVVAAIPLEEATVLMGATRTMRVAMPKLPRGKYTLLAIVDFGGEQLTTVQAVLDMR